MSDTLEKLERTLGQQLGPLADRLRAPTLSPNSMERVKALVLRENARFLRRQRWLRTIRPWLSAAAAIALMILIRLPGPTPPTDSGAPDPGTLLSEWVTAVEESSDHVTMLLVDEWAPNGGRTPADQDRDLDDLLDSLDQSRTLLWGA